MDKNSLRAGHLRKEDRGSLNRGGKPHKAEETRRSKKKVNELIILD